MPSGLGRPADTDGIRSSSFRSSRSVAIEQGTVERQCLLRDRVPGVAPGRGRTCRRRQPPALLRLVQQLLDRRGELDGRVRRYRACSALRRDLLEPADRGDDDRLPECERRVEDARLVDLPVRQRNDVRAAEERWYL